MDPTERRAHLAITARPGGGRLDYVISLDGEVETAAAGAPLAVTLRYVPDKWVVDPTSFARYLAAVAAGAWPSLEMLAAVISDDLVDALIPRWSQLAVTSEDAGLGHAILLEDRQPQWDNPVLLGRLRKW